MMNAQQIAWIGLGKLGLPMAARVAAAGHAIRGFDLSAARAAQAEGRGVARAASVAEAVTGAGVIFASLPDDRALRAAVLADGALLDRMDDGAILIETSTVSVTASAAVAAKAAERGIAYLRAPVSGNPVTAEAGELSAMVSGPREAFAAVEPVMASFCKAQAWLGEGEQGRVAKLAINLMIAVSAGMMAEALALAQRHDIEWTDMLELMETSAVASPMVKYKCLPLKSRDYTATFSGRQMAKDLDLILDAARDAETPVPLAALMRQTYSAMMATGTADDDYVATVKHLEMLSGIASQTA